MAFGEQKKIQQGDSSLGEGVGESRRLDRWCGARAGKDLHFQTEIWRFCLEIMESWRPVSRGRIKFRFKRKLWSIWVSD